MKKTSNIKIVCVIAVLLSIITYQTFFSYKKLDPHIVLVKESTSFLHQTLTMGQPLDVEGQRGYQYYGYLYVNGMKKAILQVKMYNLIHLMNLLKKNSHHSLIVINNRYASYMHFIQSGAMCLLILL